MLDRELTYQMPLERLIKLSRMASRKAFAASWGFVVLLLATYAAGLWLWIAFGHPIDRWLETHSLPGWLPLAALVSFLVLGFLAIRRFGKRQMKERVDFDASVRFREVSDGLRFATPQIEYLVKWHGISQLMLVEAQGLLVSHGALFFLVPNEAFRDTTERDVLAREIYGRLSEAARARSEKFIRPVLDTATGSTTGH